MPHDKVRRVPEYREVIYDEEHWKLLREKRKIAIKIMKALGSCGLTSVVHGSIARGDVKETSDVDVFIPIHGVTHLVEVCLEKHGFRPYYKLIVQATPANTPKAYIVLEPRGLIVVSFPIAKLKPREIEFYKFGGLATLDMLIKNVRVPGVTKELVLIEPTAKGHRELPVIGNEGYVAKILNISIDTVLERVRVLTRRDQIGRTGVFLKRILSSDESFEEALRDLCRKHSIFRRAVEENGICG